MSDLNQTVDEPGRESVPPVSAESTPSQIGRYRVERMLGKGGFDDCLGDLAFFGFPFFVLQIEG
jgi:hypothetical protein